MAEEDHPSTAETRSETHSSGTEGHHRTEGQDAAAGSEPGEGPQEGKASGLLREAIQKVMREIEHHEHEAQKHHHQAQTLRKELRESLAFLRAEGNKGPSTETSDEAAPASASSTAETPPAASKGLRAGSRKRAARKKARGG